MESEYRRFTGKVFRVEEIHELIELFQGILREMREESTELEDYKQPRSEFRIYYKNGSASKSDEFDKELLDDTKEIENIKLSLTSLISDERVEVSLREYYGEYSIASSDKDWVFVKRRYLDDYINVVPNQYKLFSNFKWQVTLNVVITLFLQFLIYNFIMKKILSEVILADLFGHTMAYLSSFGIALVTAVFFLEKFIYRLYPDIEFDTVRSHLNQKKKTRNFIFVLSTVIVIPLIISFISSMFF
ncbi:hypothetical protein [Salinicoccus roseus]|uniref:hypothetical protein n=1 Tax=Salinicoccus roseus TaxID=45670 RepID=UPI002301D8F4|nr:hypothetical protein [Salinicoccus roseus]